MHSDIVRPVKQRTTLYIILSVNPGTRQELTFVEGLAQGMVYGDVSEITGPSNVDLARYVQVRC